MRTSSIMPVKMEVMLYGLRPTAIREEPDAPVHFVRAARTPFT